MPTLLECSAVPKWLKEILAILRVAAITVAILAIAVAMGIAVAIKIGNGNPWVAVVTAFASLLFIFLPLRLWWIMRRSG
jgi:hypothetical protein